MQSSTRHFIGCHADSLTSADIAGVLHDARMGNHAGALSSLSKLFAERVKPILRRPYS